MITTIAVGEAWWVWPKSAARWPPLPLFGTDVVGCGGAVGWWSWLARCGTMAGTVVLLKPMQRAAAVDADSVGRDHLPELLSQ